MELNELLYVLLLVGKEYMVLLDNLVQVFLRKGTVPFREWFWDSAPRLSPNEKVHEEGISHAFSHAGGLED